MNVCSMTAMERTGSVFIQTSACINQNMVSENYQHIIKHVSLTGLPAGNPKSAVWACLSNKIRKIKHLKPILKHPTVKRDEIPAFMKLQNILESVRSKATSLQGFLRVKGL